MRQRRAGRLKGDEASCSSPANSGPDGAAWNSGWSDGLGELRATLQARYGVKVHLPVIAPRRRLLSRIGLGATIEGLGPSTLAAIEEAPALATFRTLGDGDEPSQPREPGGPRRRARLVRHAFQALPRHRLRGARAIFAEDMIAFGTFTDFMIGRELAEQKQWRNVWGTIRNFR